MYKNFVFIAGHTLCSPGATAYNGLTEYIYYEPLIWQLATIPNCFVAHRFYENYNRYTLSLMDYIPKDYLVIEAHFNSSAGEVQGCEALTSKRNYVVQTAAEILLEDFSTAFGLRNRGVKTPGRHNNYRGQKLVERVPNSIIFELFFGNHKDSVSSYFLENPMEAHSKLVRFFKKYCSKIDSY